LHGVADGGNAEWEKNVALKLNEYGWSATNGGILNWHYVFGHIENPQNHLYVNHPPGMIWLYALFIKIFGCEYIRLIPLLANFIGLTSIYYLSKKYFHNRTAIFSAIILSFLPGTLFLDRSLNIIALSTTFWIFIVIFTMRWYESNDRKDMFLVIIAIVAATQVDWVSFLMLPFMMAGIKILAKKEHHKRYVYCLLLAFTAAGLIYLTEIIVYTKNYKDLFGYLSGQTFIGSTGGGTVSFAEIQKKILTKLMLYTNPIAIILAAFGFFLILRSNNKIHLYISLMLFGPFVVMLIVFNKFMYIEIPPYKLIAPFAAVMGGYALSRLIDTRPKIHSLDVVAFAIVLIFIASSVITNLTLEERKSLKSGVSLKIANELVRHTTNRDLIFSNLREKQYPFPQWEEGSWWFTSFYSDSFLRFDIRSVDQILKFKGQTRMDPTIYMHVPQAAGVDMDFSSNTQKISL
jgi:4-amino-4-deoxy-L-arabinose transferase-like glycosyltransferase